jgi:hypothetical protein
MAQVVGVFNTAHSPFCYRPPEKWNDVRASRSLREDVPWDDLEENRKKADRVRNGFATLRAKMAEIRPDAVIVIGDDQNECFDFANFPSFAIYVGEEFEGYNSGYAHDGLEERPEKVRLKGHPALGVGVLTGLMQHGFDPAFSMEMPKPDRGVGHAIMRPAESIIGYETPVLPVLLNCYYAPQPTAARCYEFGKALRRVIEAYPDDLRVAVVGSGGLWHTPGAKDAYLDEDFDREMMRLLEAGDIKGMAEHFDAYEVVIGDASQDVSVRGRSATGMPTFGGPQGGTRETCNWIAASAVADGRAHVIVDYIPVYASPIGAGFSYCI